MNRRERRNIENGKINIKSTFTFNDYVYYYNLAMADALYCELGMDSTKVQNVFIKVNETMSCMRNGNLNTDDLQEMCKEELGITFVKSLKGRE